MLTVINNLVNIGRKYMKKKTAVDEVKCENCHRECSRTTRRYTNKEVEELWRADTFEYIRKIEIYKKEIEYLKNKLSLYSENTYDNS